MSTPSSVLTGKQAPSSSGLTDALLSSIRCCKSIPTPSTSRVNSMNFFETGEYFLTSSDDKTIKLYNCNTGTCSKTTNIAKCGVGLARFTHHASAVLASSQAGEWEESIRYLSLHDNRDLRYFRGHRARVTALEMCPFEDTFLSASLDNTIRLWDLRSPLCQGQLTVPTASLAVFDPEGLVFAVVTENNTVQLFNRRMYEAGPFKVFQIDSPLLHVQSLSFSPDGATLVTAGVIHRSASSSSSPSSSPQHDALDGRVILSDAFEGTKSLQIDVPILENPASPYAPKQMPSPAVLEALGASSLSSSNASSTVASTALAAATPVLASTFPTPTISASMSPDCAYVTVGSTTGSIRTYSTKNGTAVSTWWHQSRVPTPTGSSSTSTSSSTTSSASSTSTSSSSSTTTTTTTTAAAGTCLQAQAVTGVLWNPCKAMVASTDPSQLVFWAPVPSPSSSTSTSTSSSTSQAGKGTSTGIK